MGEVWKAQDIIFKRRFVAVKLLKEDDTLRDDAVNRERLLAGLREESSAGTISVGTATNLLDEVLRSGKGRDALKAKVLLMADASGQVPSAAIPTLFDELVLDTTCCENARVRAALRRRFDDEANAVAELQHPNIVSVTDYGDYKGVPFLVMDYIEGPTIQRLIQRGALSDRIQQLKLMEDLCSGLAYAHGRNLVHRHIKPANLMVVNGTLKILDFGVVRRLQEPSESQFGFPIGTFCYMSPEQFAGSPSIDKRSDIFAVGVVFYEILTGRKAFPPGDGMTDLMNRIQRSPPPAIRDTVPDLEPEVERILMRALEKNRDARYQDLSDMKRELERARARLDSTAPVSPQMMVRAILDGGVRALEDGNLTSAGNSVARALEILPNDTSVLRFKARVDEAARQRLLDRILGRSQSHLQSGDIAAARATWEEARALNAEATAVSELDVRIRTAEAAVEADRIRAARLASLLSDARGRLEAGAAVPALALAREALALDASSTEARALIQAAELRIEQDRTQQLRGQIEDLVTRANIARTAGAWPDAKALIDQAAALDPTREDLIELGAAIRRDEHADTDATQVLQRVDVLQARGQRQQAIDLIVSEPTVHPKLSERLKTLQEELALLEQERARQLASDIDERIARVHTALTADDPAAAEIHLASLEAIAPSHPILSSLQGQINALRARQSAHAEARGLVAAADALAADGRLEEARRLLTALSPSHPVVLERLRLLDREIDAERRRQVDAWVDEAAGAVEAGEFDRGIERLERATQLAPERADVAALLARARGRHREAELAILVAEAKRMLLAGDLAGSERAIAAVRRFEPKARVLNELTKDLKAARRATRTVSPRPAWHTRAVVAGGLAVALSVAGMYFYSHFYATRPTEPTVAGPVSGEKTSDAGPGPVPPVPSGKVTVTVDLYPWARVTIKGEGAPTDAKTTPFVVSLLPGQYVLHAENGGLTNAKDFQLTVRSGPPQSFRDKMPGFDANAVAASLVRPAQ